LFLLFSIATVLSMSIWKSLVDLRKEGTTMSRNYEKLFMEQYRECMTRQRTWTKLSRAMDTINLVQTLKSNQEFTMMS